MTQSPWLRQLALGTLGGSCCIVQLALNTFGWGCAGLVSALTPWRPALVSLSLAQLLWTTTRLHARGKLTHRWALVVAVVLALNATPELVRTWADKQATQAPQASLTYQTIQLSLPGMHCEACRAAVVGILQGEEVVQDVLDVDLDAARARVHVPAHVDLEQAERRLLDALDMYDASIQK